MSAPDRGRPGVADGTVPDTAPPMRGRRLGIDVGDVRVGLAESDLDGMIATPVETLPREEAVRRILAHAAETDPLRLYIGLPRKLDGSEGPAARKARDLAVELQRAAASTGQELPEIRLVDERLSTVTAHQALHSSGRKGRKHRSVVDQVAAVMILQTALDAERSTGRPAGEPVGPQD